MLHRRIGTVTATIAACALLVGLGFAGKTHAQEAEGAVSTPPANVSGSWSGTDSGSDNAGNWSNQPMTLTISQRGRLIHGTFSLTTNDETPSGVFNGRVIGDEIKAIFHASTGSKHSCTARVTASVDTSVNPAQMSGSFVVVKNRHCQGSGTFDLTQQ